MKSVSHVSRERATIGDVAARAEVSPATVSRVLNGVENVQEEYRRRVLAAIEDRLAGTGSLCRPPSTAIVQACSSSAWRDSMESRATAPTEASASPRNRRPHCARPPDRRARARRALVDNLTSWSTPRGARPRQCRSRNVPESGLPPGRTRPPRDGAPPARAPCRRFVLPGQQTVARSFLPCYLSSFRSPSAQLA